MIPSEFDDHDVHDALHKIDGICLSERLNEELSQNAVLGTFLTHLSSPDRYERNLLPGIPGDLLSES